LFLVSEALHPTLEPQVVPSALPEQSELASTPLLSSEASKMPPYQPSSTIPNTHGFNFAPNLSQLRLPRAREHHIVFHAPLDSPSPSRTTQRSLSDPSISVPPPDLSELQIVSTAPEPGTPGSQEIQTSFTTEPQLQQSEPARPPVQAQAPSMPDSPPVQAVTHPVTHPEFVLEPVGPGFKLNPINIGGLHQSYDVFQPGGEYSNMANPNSEPSNNQSHAMENLNLNTTSIELQTETQNGFDQQRPHHENRNQPNGHAQSSLGSIQSVSLEYWPLPSDPEEHAVPTVSDQLTRLFITKEWADWSIEVSSPVTHLDPVSYVAHGLLMARSPTLRQEMQRKMFSHRLERVIVISPDWYIQPQGFEAVMRYLYTESLLTAPEVEQMSCIGAPEDGPSTRDYQHLVVLSYWMTSLVLKLPLVVDRAVQLVQEMLNWDVLELAFQQALILEERALNPSADLLTTQPNTPGSSRAASAFAASLRNISRSPFSPSDHFLHTAYLNATQDYRYPHINAIMSKEIKRIVYEFISQRVDVSNFEVDVSSTTSILRSYLPNIHEYSNSSRYNFNPALASIRFGDMPPTEKELAPVTAQWAISRSTAKVTSAILLNLKYADLREFCQVLKDTIGPSDDNRCEWIQKLVEEREQRRRKVLSSKTVSDQERLSQKQAWNIVGWEEYIDINDDPVRQWEICQKWTGFTLPARR
jgi:hypothetical protein